MPPDPQLAKPVNSAHGGAQELTSPSSHSTLPHARHAPLAGGLDFTHRANLTELMDEPCSRDTMRACLRDLARVNRWFLAYRPVLDWLEQSHFRAHTVPLRILDVGCGFGDTLRRIERWASVRQVPVELTGIDLNPDTIQIAAEATPAHSRIQWLAADIFQYRAPHAPHLVLSSLFTHHLRDGDVVRFLQWMEKHALLGWFVNDLSRAKIPYHLFRWFSRLTRLHPFVQNDGPVSIARAFSREDWHQLASLAGLEPRTYAVLSYKPARLCVRRNKTQ